MLIRLIKNSVHYKEFNILKESLSQNIHKYNTIYSRCLLFMSGDYEPCESGDWHNNVYGVHKCGIDHKVLYSLLTLAVCRWLWRGPSLLSLLPPTVHRCLPRSLHAQLVSYVDTGTVSAKSNLKLICIPMVSRHILVSNTGFLAIILFYLIYNAKIKYYYNWAKILHDSNVK